MASVWFDCESSSALSYHAGFFRAMGTIASVGKILCDTQMSLVKEAIKSEGCVGVVDEWLVYLALIT